MRVLADVETGELVEVLDEYVKDLTPYNYREAKAAAMRSSVERRKAVQEYGDAGDEAARAEVEYRRALAVAITRLRHAGAPATGVEALAKGEEEVLEARETLSLALSRRDTARERIRGCDGDRQGVVQLTAWSREVAGQWGE